MSEPRSPLWAMILGVFLILWFVVLVSYVVIKVVS